MTEAQAIKRADHLAKLRGEEHFVVFTDDYDRGKESRVCDLDELQTFYLGVEPVYSTAMAATD